MGDPQMIPQGTRRTEGSIDASLVQPWPTALEVVISRLEEGERLFRVAKVHSVLEEELWRHARIQIHQGKTKIWNKGGFAPVDWEYLEAGARIMDPNAIVWRGNGDISPARSKV